MRSIRARRDRFALAAAAALATAGCRERLSDPIAAAHPDDPAPRRGGTLRLATFGDVRTLDPATSADQLSGMADALLFAGLVTFDGDGQVQPDAASHWDTSPDGRATTFYLRPDVRFHDGVELTADDVKRSVERALHPGTPNPFSSYYETLVGFEAYAAGRAEHLEGVEVAGRYVVRFHLTRADATFVALLALPSTRPVCRSAGARYTDDWLPCGAGPFKLAPGGWEHGRSLTLTRHEAYFRRGRPHLDAVQFTYGMNLLTQRYKFEAGELDVLRDINDADAIRFTADTRWAALVTREPAVATFGECMNTELPPFDNVEVRRAVASAVDREHYRLLKRSSVVPSGRVVPPDVPGYDDAVPGQTFDRARALEHMKRAGYAYDPATDRGGYPPTIPYVTIRQGFSEYAAQVLKQDLAKIGLRLDVRPVSYATYLTLTQRRGQVALSPQSWQEDFPDPLAFYEPLFTSKSIGDENSTNAAFYKNPAFDDLVGRARGELDPARRRELLARADAILQGDAPWAFTHTYRGLVVRQPYVRDLRAHPTWLYQLDRTWLDRAKDLVAIGFFTPPRGRARRGTP